MEFFESAASVRLKSCCYGKYMCAKDERLVSQERERNEKGTIWSVEKVTTGSNDSVRIKSINGMYLTALEVALLLGDKGNKVQQSYSSKADSAVEWEPIRVGNHQLNLRTKRGTYLRANGGMPPYKNSVTHSGTKKEASLLNCFLWEVEVVEYLAVDKGTLQSLTPLKKMEHESIPAKIGAPDYVHQISPDQRRHRVSLEDVQEFVTRSVGNISLDDAGDYIGRTPHDNERRSRPVSSDGTERGARISVDDEREGKVRTPRSRDGRPGPISSEGTESGTKISSDERGQAVRTPGNREHRSRPVAVVDGTERRTRISLDDETKDKVRTPHDTDGRPGPISSQGTENGTNISQHERGKTVRTLRNGEHRSRPVSLDGTEQGTRISLENERKDKARTPRHTDGRLGLIPSKGTEHGTRKSSDEREQAMRTLRDREPRSRPVSFEDTERGPRISLDEEREDKARTPRHRDGRPGQFSSEGTEHGTRTSSDERERIAWTPGNGDGRLRPTSFDGDGRGTRISSDERGQGMRTPPHRDHTLRPVSYDEIDHGTRISSDESEHRLRTAGRDRQVRLPPTSSNDSEQYESRISLDEREQRFRTHRDRERARLPISPDVKEHRGMIFPLDTDHVGSTSGLRIAAADDDRDLSTFPRDGHKPRISSDSRERRVTRVSREPAEEERREMNSPNDHEQRRRFLTDDKEHKSRLSSGEGHALRDSSGVEGRGSKILSNDEEHNSASISSDYEHRHRIPFDHKQHKFFRHERERESPIASPGHRLNPSADDRAEQKRTSHERKPNKVESATRHRDSLDEEEKNSPKNSRDRRIFFTVANAHGKYSSRHEESFIFIGNNVNDLKQELRIHTKMEDDIFVYLRNESDGKLFNLTRTLPPSNVSMHVVVARVNSEVGRKMQQW